MQSRFFLLLTIIALVFGFPPAGCAADLEAKRDTEKEVRFAVSFVKLLLEYPTSPDKEKLRSVYGLFEKGARSEYYKVFEYYNSLTRAEPPAPLFDDATIRASRIGAEVSIEIPTYERTPPNHPLLTYGGIESVSSKKFYVRVRAAQAQATRAEDLRITEFREESNWPYSAIKYRRSASRCEKALSECTLSPTRKQTFMNECVHVGISSQEWENAPCPRLSSGEPDER